jgi:6-phospho-beta-glucosidase
VLNLAPSYWHAINAADKYAAHIADLFFNESFLEPSKKVVLVPVTLLGIY